MMIINDWRKPGIDRKKKGRVGWWTKDKTCVCVCFHIYDVSPVSRRGCHAPLPPMHDNYSAPDSVNNKRDQGSARRRPATVGKQNWAADSFVLSQKCVCDWKIGHMYRYIQSTVTVNPCENSKLATADRDKTRPLLRSTFDQLTSERLAAPTEDFYQLRGQRAAISQSAILLVVKSSLGTLIFKASEALPFETHIQKVICPAPFVRNATSSRLRRKFAKGRGVLSNYPPLHGLIWIYAFDQEPFVSLHRS